MLEDLFHALWRIRISWLLSCCHLQLHVYDVGQQPEVFEVASTKVGPEAILCLASGSYGNLVAVGGQARGTRAQRHWEES